MTLKIAPDLSLPVAAVTEKLAFLGRTGSGKTYAAQKLAEEMHRAQAQFVVLDPVGVWYGLRLLADGKSPGLPVPVLGGLHGDIPLEATGGALIANLVVDRGVSMVLDVSQFESAADQARFAHAFADRFFFRKKAAPSAVHVFIEEAQEFVPQNPQREEARMLHAFTRMVKIGRNFGIGVSLISQRPQEVNKKVLNLTELLFCFQLTGPQERKTIQGWIAEKGIDEDIAGELPKLDIGQSHVWSPAWLKISERIRIAPKKTLDVSSTPTVGHKAAARDLSPIDLEGLRKEMAATIEKAKAEDPRELRRQLAEARTELAKSRANMQKPIPATKEKRVEVPVLKDAQVKRLEQALERVDALASKGLGAVADAAAEVRTALLFARREREAPSRPAPGVAPRPVWNTQPRVVRSGPPAEGLTGPQQAILDTVAVLDARGIRAERDSVARWLGIHPNGGSYGANLGHLRAEGYLEGFILTEKGRRAHAIADTGLDSAMFAVGDEPKRKILRVLINVGKPLSREELAERLGLHPNGGSYGANLGWLRTMGLITDRGPITTTEALFR